MLYFYMCLLLKYTDEKFSTTEEQALCPCRQSGQSCCIMFRSVHQRAPPALTLTAKCKVQSNAVEFMQCNDKRKGRLLMVHAMLYTSIFSRPY